MYSPNASAGSISFVILVRAPESSTWTFISSWASTFSVSRASSTCGPRASSNACLDGYRVHGVAVEHQRAVAHVSSASHIE